MSPVSWMCMPLLQSGFCSSKSQRVRAEWSWSPKCISPERCPHNPGYGGKCPRNVFLILSPKLQHPRSPKCVSSGSSHPMMGEQRSPKCVSSVIVILSIRKANIAWITLSNSRTPSVIDPFGFLKPAIVIFQNCKSLGWNSRLNPLLDLKSEGGPYFWSWNPVLTSSQGWTLECHSTLNGLALAAIWALFFKESES